MKNFTTTDLALAAYLLMNGAKILSVQNSRPYQFVFENNDNKCNDLSIDFLNSESSKFDDSMKKIKTILKNSK
jgi:hypothetical protein